jgi:hypothetical protein
MGQHLFTKEELEAYQSRMAAIDELHGYHDRKQKEFNYDKYAADREACKQAHEIEIIKRAQARPDDFLNALLVLVGNRGSTYVPFESAFANNDDPQLVAQIKQHDTDENRRWLYTLLRGHRETSQSQVPRGRHVWSGLRLEGQGG